MRVQDLVYLRQKYFQIRAHSLDETTVTHIFDSFLCIVMKNSKKADLSSLLNFLATWERFTEVLKRSRHLWQFRPGAVFEQHPRGQVISELIVF